MEINVTNVKVKDVNQILRQLKKLYPNVHLKSSRTKTGGKTCIVFHKRGKK